MTQFRARLNFWSGYWFILPEHRVDHFKRIGFDSARILYLFYRINMRKVILTVATNKLVLLPSVVDWSGAPENIRLRVERDRKYHISNM